MEHRYSNARGFAAIFAAVLLFVACVVAIAILGSYAIRSSMRRASTGSINRDVYQGIVGSPELGTFGYVGDSGTYPSNLNSLLTVGTNGPLVRDVLMDNNGVLLDGFFGPLEFWRSVGATASTHGVVIISPGPDHASSNNAGGSGNPNDSSLFSGTTPISGTYSGTAGNADNMLVPDLISSSSTTVGYYGTLNYAFTQRDVTTGQSLSACPNMYTLEISSDTRAGTTNERILAPIAGSASFDLVQGFYTMRILANSNTNQIVYTEAVTINPGTTTTRKVDLPPVTTASTPSFKLTVKNQHTASIWIYNTQTGADVITNIGNGQTKNGLFRGCTPIQIRDNNNGTGNVLESFNMPNGTGSRTFSNGATQNLRITAATNSVVLVLTGNPAVLLGSVYKLRQKTFAAPKYQRIEIITKNLTNLQTIGEGAFTADTSVTW